jgi:hypothetical protein
MLMLLLMITQNRPRETQITTIIHMTTLPRTDLATTILIPIKTTTTWKQEPKYCHPVMP